MAMIEVKNITKSFNVKKFNKETKKYKKDILTVLRDFTVDFTQEGVTVLLGPSGTGKSTLLRCINGLETIDQGDILVDGLSVKDKKNLGKIRQTCGVVFQQTVLLPHKDVLNNLTMAPMKLLGMSKNDAEDRARQLLDKVGLLSKEKASAISPPMAWAHWRRYPMVSAAVQLSICTVSTRRYSDTICCPTVSKYAWACCGV